MVLFEQEFGNMEDLVSNLTDVPKELSRMDEELGLHKTVMRGQRIYEENQLRCDKMIADSAALKETQLLIDRLQCEVKNL
jgi:hypothetical protein